MNLLVPIANRIDAFIAWTGRTVSWLVLGAVLVTFVVVVMRYAFDFGRIWIQESYIWMHASVFMIGAAWTLQDEGHVRVDIIYRKLSERKRCWINLLGSIFLLFPTCSFILWVSTPYVVTSWQLLEGSRETGGIPAIFLLKTVIPLMASLLILQGISMTIHNWARLTGREPYPVDETSHE